MSNSPGPIPISILIDEVAGLRPSTWFCVGPGFSREELKSLVLNSGRAFVADAITTCEEIARKIVESAEPVKMLSPLARQEGLRILLSNSRIAAHLPELKRLRRQGSFFRRLDQAIQAGRLAVAHAEEEAVFEERLLQRFGPNPIREEVRTLARAYEAWLAAMGFCDPPSLIRRATETLLSSGWPASKASPRKILVFSTQEPESLERSFWEALGQFVEVKQLRDLDFSTDSSSELKWEWELWHTQDDACQRLADVLGQMGPPPDGDRDGNPNWKTDVVLMADVPSVRRSLKRALKQAGIPEADPRDPTRLESDEALKWALLPLELVARNFERAQVCAWAQAHLPYRASRIIEEIALRGVRQGLRSYAGDERSPLHELYTELEKLAGALGGKKTCEEFARAHLSVLKAGLDALAARELGVALAARELGVALAAREFGVAPAARESSLGNGSRFAELAWLSPFFEGFWKQFCEDWQMLGLSRQRAPILYWLEKLKARMDQTPAPVERIKPREGVRVYRLQQAPLTSAGAGGEGSFKTVWIVGISANWLAAQGVGDYWYGEREREALSSEFSVRSGIQVREERLRSLKAWLRSAERVVILDSQYGPDGRERENILPLLKEFKELRDCGGALPEGPLEKGAHPRWAASYGALRPLQPQSVKLSPLPRSAAGGPPEFSATTLERYSKCSFQSLAMDRWRLRDAREPDCELWADMRGNILHEAVKILLKNWVQDGEAGEGTFGCSPKDALDRAWELKPPRGLIKSRPMELYLRSRMLAVLESFCEKEREYRKRSGARTISLDEAKLRMEFQDFCVTGTPDRIDETDDGLFLIDYKTSSSLPNGTEMIETGYRLQLPFYALAAGRGEGKPVLGVQFIELNRKASRGSGIFFKKYNGKEPGKLTAVTTRSKSLVQLDPEEAWLKLEEHLLSHGGAYARGEFSAAPKKPDKECSSCVVGDLCGYRRRVSDGLQPGEGENGD